MSPDGVTWCEAMRLFGIAGRGEEVERVHRASMNWMLMQRGEETMHGGQGVADMLPSPERAVDEVDGDAGTVVLRSMLSAARVSALAQAQDLASAVAACEEFMNDMSACLPVALTLDIHMEESSSKNGLTTSLVHEKNNTATTTTVDGSISRKDASAIDHLRSACNTILHAAEYSSTWDVMRQIVRLMSARGLPPDVITFNSLLRGALKQGQGPVAMQVRQVMF